MVSGTPESSKTPKAIQDRTLGSKVPGIAVLRGQLDISDETDSGNAFYYKLLSFRAIYRTKNGVQGNLLLNWEPLEQMAIDFLDQEQHGSKYWPNDCDPATTSKKLQYSNDKEL